MEEEPGLEHGSPHGNHPVASRDEGRVVLIPESWTLFPFLSFKPRPQLGSEGRGHMSMGLGCAQWPQPLSDPTADPTSLSVEDRLPRSQRALGGVRVLLDWGSLRLDHQVPQPPWSTASTDPLTLPVKTFQSRLLNLGTPVWGWWPPGHWRAVEEGEGSNREGSPRHR